MVRRHHLARRSRPTLEVGNRPVLTPLTFCLRFFMAAFLELCGYHHGCRLRRKSAPVPFFPFGIATLDEDQRGTQTHRHPVS